MQVVADIESFGGDFGLRAFSCSACGAVDSVLVPPTGPIGHAPAPQRIGVR
jgi:hypothetical protein